MSVSRCLDNALRIARTPRPTWRAQLSKLPEACQHPSVCTGGVGCYRRNFDFLYAVAKAGDVRAERMAAAKAAQS